MKGLRITALCGGCVLLLAGAAFAGQAASNTGCGLGTILWGNKADNSVFSQSLQATTNGIFGNQTFGITSGTLGCDQPANIAASERLMEFTVANMDSLARDIARGEGESLATLAELLAVPAENRGEFYANLQGNFADIFITGEESAANVLDRIVVASN
ncbi:MAG TPA: DUF3015 family protein [Desulfuromonadales bacterium]|nr:DUF3015 family protein [Desulfuromonadales bacterium]